MSAEEQEIVRVVCETDTHTGHAVDEESK